MKKILLLGGSAQQVVAIETAKRLGYYTVLCDYLPDNPGQYAADKFYPVSTTDKDAVLKVAQAEKINGVIAYASDPAAPTAAHVAERLGLPANPYISVETLCSKDKFRTFLKENGFDTPNARGYTNIVEAMADIDNGIFTFPIIVKPVDSSGSKGATVLHSREGVDEAFKFALSFSRSHKVIIEEFIEKNHPFLIGGDIFVNDGKIVMWGLMNCHRDSCVNPLVPVGKSYPPILSDDDLKKAKDTLQRLVDKLNIKFGAMNIELVVNAAGKVFLIDVGPRSGGNMIPDLLGMIFNVDVVEMSLRAAMGEPIYDNIGEGSMYYATHNLHSPKNGEYKGVIFDKEIEPYIARKCLYKNEGDKVEYFDNASKALGIVFFKFNNNEQMLSILNNINNYIKVEVK